METQMNIHPVVMNKTEITKLPPGITPERQFIVQFIHRLITPFGSCLGQGRKTPRFQMMEIMIKVRKSPEIRRISGLLVVGVSGFEPEASWTRTKRDTKLRHTPISLTIIKK